MKPTVVRVVIFSVTLRAHREFFHGCVRAVIRERFYDREAGTTVRTVRERIKVAAVLPVEDFAQATRTGGCVGQDQGGLFAATVAGTYDLHAVFALLWIGLDEVAGDDLLRHSTGSEKDVASVRRQGNHDPGQSGSG